MLIETVTVACPACNRVTNVLIRFAIERMGGPSSIHDYCLHRIENPGSGAVSISNTNSHS